MACEAEKARLQAAESRYGQLGAACSSVCSQYGHNSTECSDCQSQREDAFGAVREAQQALNECLAANPPPPPPKLLELQGHVSFLLVVEPGSGYGGGSSNFIDADVIFKLDSRPDKAFGFQLRDDGSQPVAVRQGMLALLREAIVHNLKVITDYFELSTPPNQNSFVLRVALTKLPVAGGDHQVHP